MMATVSISLDAIFRLHPTAVKVDGKLVVDAFGSLAARYAPSIAAGRCLSDLFDIAPEPTPDKLAQVAANGDELDLVSKEREIRLRAAIIATSTDFLLVMRPVLENPGQTPSGWHIADFPPGDPLVQSLLQIALLECLRDEADRNARDLKRAWEEIGEVLAQMRSITGFMSHELSNLLSIIQLNCERIAPLGTAASDVTRSILLIREAADRGSSLAQWLQALSVDADLSHHEPLDRLLLAYLPLIEILSGADVNVTSRLDAGRASIDAPACGLLNCLVSIIRAVGAQSVEASSAHLETLEGPASADGHPMVEIRVSISGIGGIDGNDFLRHSQGYFIGHEANRFSINGFVRSAGGTARYEAAGETGGVVSLLIPCARAAAAAVAPHTPDRSDERRLGSHIVVVEDEPAALEALVELLEFEGFAVTGCCDAEQALVALADRPDAVLVTDVVLPSMDGFALAREARSVNPLLHVVVMSGHVPDPRCYDASWAFVRKPLNFDDLVAAINQVNI